MTLRVQIEGVVYFKNSTPSNELLVLTVKLRIYIGKIYKIMNIHQVYSPQTLCPPPEHCEYARSFSIYLMCYEPEILACCNVTNSYLCDYNYSILDTVYEYFPEYATLLNIIVSIFFTLYLIMLYSMARVLARINRYINSFGPLKADENLRKVTTLMKERVFPPSNIVPESDEFFMLDFHEYLHEMEDMQTTVRSNPPRQPYPRLNLPWDDESVDSGGDIVTFVPESAERYNINLPWDHDYASWRWERLITPPEEPRVLSPEYLAEVHANFEELPFFGQEYDPLRFQEFVTPEAAIAVRELYTMGPVRGCDAAYDTMILSNIYGHIRSSIEGRIISKKSQIILGNAVWRRQKKNARLTPSIPLITHDRHLGTIIESASTIDESYFSVGRFRPEADDIFILPKFFSKMLLSNAEIESFDVDHGPIFCLFQLYQERVPQHVTVYPDLNRLVFKGHTVPLELQNRRITHAAEFLMNADDYDSGAYIKSQYENQCNTFVLVSNTGQYCLLKTNYSIPIPAFLAFEDFKRAHEYSFNYDFPGIGLDVSNSLTNLETTVLYAQLFEMRCPTVMAHYNLMKSWEDPYSRLTRDEYRMQYQQHAQYCRENMRPGISKGIWTSHMAWTIFLFVQLKLPIVVALPFSGHKPIHDSAYSWIFMILAFILCKLDTKTIRAFVSETVLFMRSMREYFSPEKVIKKTDYDVERGPHIRAESAGDSFTQASLNQILGLNPENSSIAAVSNVAWIMVGICTGPRVSQGKIRFALHTASIIRHLLIDMDSNLRCIDVLKLFNTSPVRVLDISAYRAEDDSFASTDSDFFANMESFFKNGKINSSKTIKMLASFWSNIILANGVLNSAITACRAENVSKLNVLEVIQKELIAHDCSVDAIMEGAFRTVKFFALLAQTRSVAIAYNSMYSESEKMFYELQIRMGEISVDKPGASIDYYDLRQRILKLYYTNAKSALEAYGAEKTFFNTRTKVINNWLMLVDSRVSDGVPKRAPFVLTLYGGAGVGKSASIDDIDNHLHRILGLSEIQRRGISVDGDKYDSNITSRDTSILIDDMGNMLQNIREVSPVESLLRLCSTVITPALKSESGEKGKVFLNHEILLITTNVPDGGCCCDTNEPNSVIRRLGLTIRARVLPDYQDSRGGVDVDKIKVFTNPDAKPWMRYDEYRLFSGIGGVHTEYIKENSDMTYGELLILITARCRAHREHENRRLENHARRHQYCSHGYPATVCTVCNSGFQAEAWSYRLRSKCFLPANVIPKRIVKVYSLYILYSRMCEYFGDFSLEAIKKFLVVSFLLLFSTFLLISPLCAIIILACFAVLVFKLYKIQRAFEELMTYNMDLVASSYYLQYDVTLPFIAKLVLTTSILGFVTNYFVRTAVGVCRPEGEESILMKNEVENCEEFQDIKFERQLTVPQVKQRGEEGLPNWQRVQRIDPALNLHARGAGPESLELIRRNLFWAIFTHEESNLSSRIQCLFLDKLLLLFPSHIWYKGGVLVDKLTLTLYQKPTPDSAYKKLTKVIHRGASTYIDWDKDICIMSHQFFADKRSLIHLFAPQPPTGSGEFIHARLLRDCTYSHEKVYSEDRYIEYSLEDGVKSYSYPARQYVPSEKNEVGWCGSVLCRINKGFFIVGMHTAGSSDPKEKLGIVTLLTAGDIKTATAYLFNNHCYVAPSDHGNLKVNYAHQAEIKLDNLPHSKSVLNYQYEVIPVFGSTKQGQFTPSCNVIENIHWNKFGKPILGVERHYYKPECYKFNLNAWGVVNNSCANTVEASRNTLKIAVDDMLIGAQELCSDKFATRFTKRSFLSIDEALNGIDGNPYHSAINASTSAGYPFNTQKSVLMEGEPGQWRLKKQIHKEFSELWSGILAGQHTGTCFIANLKNEAVKDPKKAVRIFFAGAFYSYLIVKMVLGDVIALINSNPDFFETSIGLNVTSDQWHKRVSKSFEFGIDCINLDFSKYDQTQNSAISIAAANYILFLMKYLGYSDYELEIAQYVCHEFLSAIINVKGAFCLLNNLHPSGYLLTAHLGGLKGSLAMRVAFIECHGIESGLTFKDYVWLNNLGDDNDAVLSPLVDKSKFNAVTLSEAIINMGMYAKNAVDKEQALDSFVSHQNRIFLKRETFYNCDLKRLVGVLDPVSIYRPFQMISDSPPNMGDYTIDICRNAAHEMFYYGREMYDKTINRLCLYCDAIQVPRCPEIELTYDERLVLDAERNEAFEIHPNFPIKPNFRHVYPDLVQAQAESEEVHGLTMFAGDHGETSSEEPIVKYSALSASGPGVSLGGFLDREIEGPVFRFDVATTNENIYYPFSEYFKHLSVRDKVRHYLYFNCSFEIRFVLSASSQHSGAFMVTNTPHAGVDDLFTIADNEMRLLTLSQRQCVQLYIGWHNEAKMIVPFVYEKPMCTFEDAILMRLSKVQINVIGTINHTANASAPVYIQTYVRACNLKLAGPTSIRVESEEKISDRLSALGGGLEVAAGVTSSIPALSLPLEIASKVVSAGGHLAGILGHSRPRDATSQPHYLHTTPGLAATNLPITARKLAMDNNQQVSALGAVSDSSFTDEMSFHHLNSIPNLIGRFNWNGNQAIGTSIFKRSVSPGNVLDNAEGFVCLPSQAYVAHHFRYWRGTMHYKIQIITQHTNGGRLIFYHEPNVSAPSAGLSPTHNKSLIIDIRQSKEVHIMVHWTSNEPLLFTSSPLFPVYDSFLTQCHNGFIEAEILSPLNGIGEKVPSATILLWQVACPDMVYCLDDDSVFDNFRLNINGDLVTDEFEDEDDVRSGGGTNAPASAPSANFDRVAWCKDVVCNNRAQRLTPAICAVRLNRCKEGYGEWGDNFPDNPQDYPITNSYEPLWIERPLPNKTTTVITSNGTQSGINNGGVRPLLYGQAVLTAEDLCIKEYPSSLKEIKCEVPSTAPASSPVRPPVGTVLPPQKAPSSPVVAPAKPSILDYFTGTPAKAPVKETKAPVKATNIPTNEPIVPTKAPLKVTKNPTREPIVPVTPACTPVLTTLPAYFLGGSTLFGTSYGMATKNKEHLAVFTMPVYGEPGSTVSREVTLTIGYGIENITSVTGVTGPITHRFTATEIIFTITSAPGFNLVRTKILGTSWMVVTNIKTWIPSGSSPIVEDYPQNASVTDIANNVVPAFNLTGPLAFDNSKLYTECTGSLYGVVFDGPIQVDGIQYYSEFPGTILGRNEFRNVLINKGTAGPAGTPLSILKVFYLGKKSIRAESDEYTEIPTLTIGTPDGDNEMVVRIFCGERYVSLLSLAKRFRLETSIEKPASLRAGDLENSMYIEPKNSANFLERMCTSYVATRGAMVCLYHYESSEDATMVAYRPGLSTRVVRDITQSGVEFTDTRLNPTLSVEYPFHSRRKYEVPRLYGVDNPDPLYRGVRIITHASTPTAAGFCQIYTSVGEDFSCGIFLGLPLLQIRNP